MLTTDIFTCYAVAGGGSLIGLGLMSLIRTSQPRVRDAVTLYRWAFTCLAALVLIPFSPGAWLQTVVQGAIGLAAAGVTLLAWAFRQLNGRRTLKAVGLFFTVGLGGGLWLGAWRAPDALYALQIALVFAFISLGMLLDQGWLILRSARVTRAELSLLLVAGGFAANWLVLLWYVTSHDGPYPAHWLYAPDWLTPFLGLSLALLPLAVAAVVFAIINERLRQQLRARALSDDLTGALTHRGLRELGERMLALQAHQATSVAVVMMDVDHFKAINDQHGHDVGDEVLRELAHLIREQLSPDALLARYGGQAFTLLVPVRNHLEARSVAEQLRQTLASTPCRTQAGPVHVTVSMGQCFLMPGVSLEDALASAHAGVKEAKRSGRNRVVTVHPEV